jgi:hypothetical protein
MAVSQESQQQSHKEQQTLVQNTVKGFPSEKEGGQLLQRHLSFVLPLTERLINEVLCPDNLTEGRLSGKNAPACSLNFYLFGGPYVNPKPKAAAR